MAQISLFIFASSVHSVKFSIHVCGRNEREEGKTRQAQQRNRKKKYPPK
jgi:hypothetical protein